MGEDLYTPVTSDYAKGNNKFTGKIDKVTFDLKKMSPANEATAKRARLRMLLFASIKF